jgi:hypothetical protein
VTKVGRAKRAAATWADPLAGEISTAVRSERGGAVRAHDAKVLEPIVVRDPIDVIEYERHAVATPRLVLTAELADRFL